MAAFSGFANEAFEFYAGLERDNTKAYWASHKKTYDEYVRDPMRALLAELEPEFGTAKVFRPHRDIRFSADKSPYKTHQGAIAGPSPGIGFYVQVDADGLLVGGGFHSHSGAQVDRYRTAVDADSTGAALAEIVRELDADGFQLEGERLKTRPRGIAADHPRITLLRHKSLMELKQHGRPPWVGTRAALDEVRAGWRALLPLNDWITANVGAA
ncbi:MAG TPA: DUF2461 domain-containing protein [Nocardioidaceae bacterium]|nr:DUF2461 domain-containing protein [Nocardioidaceae bacterium]